MQVGRNQVPSRHRYGEIEKAREVIQRFVMCHNVVDTWLYYAKFEEKTHQLDRARCVHNWRGGGFQVAQRCCGSLSWELRWAHGTLSTH